MNASVIYYTSNREKLEFEGKIIANLLKVCGGLPIVSVSQKPMDLGKNICVGDVGVSGFNCFRQILLACENADTKFVISAEADCLYPPDYFEFVPERDDMCYRNTNLYVMGNKRNYFYLKSGGATHAQVVGREFYIESLKKLFQGAPMWSMDERNFPKERHRKEDWYDKVEYYATMNPVVQIKTGQGMRHHTSSDRTPIYDIPYWGSGKGIYETYKRN
jgi:hypothetical protein